MYEMKKTKIVATLSDRRCTEVFVRQLHDAGMDVVRINSAHVTVEGGGGAPPPPGAGGGGWGPPPD